jgi:ABC-type molybdenum transport system ATPase subunit/photorepair protein PhrA
MTTMTTVGTKMLAEDIIKKPLGLSPHSLAAIVSSAIGITAVIVGTWVSTISRIESLAIAQVEMKGAIEAMRISGLDDRYRGKDADRTFSVMRKLNAEKYPDLKIPIPTSVRDGQIEVFK